VSLQLGTAEEMIHTETEVWKAAMGLAVDIYRVTRTLPDDERYGLSAQLNRAAVSIPSNIAEGAGRETTRDKRRFLIHARGSLNEVATQLELCRRLGFIEEMPQLHASVSRVRQLLAGTIRSLTSRLRTDNG
jgi:four helix bundle protein